MKTLINFDLKGLSYFNLLFKFQNEAYSNPILNVLAYHCAAVYQKVSRLIIVQFVNLQRNRKVD